VPETAGLIPDLLRHDMAEADEYLARQVRDLEARGLRATAHVELIVAGDVAEGLIDFARDSGADLIVMATHGRSGIGRWLLGSVADRVVRGAECPVWVVRAPV
jgi:nucleotide-binding universal stress UspA family protein